MKFPALSNSLFYTSTPLPPQLRKVFLHFAMDISWYGLLNGSILSFVSVYITRLGGTPLHVGLVNAIPGLVSLLLAIPAGELLTRRQVSWVVFISSVASRAFYVVLAIVPSLVGAQTQVTIIILAILVVAIPGTITNVGFTSLLGEGAPPEWRGTLSGIRNGLFALTNVLTLLLCGWILQAVAFPLGYQIIFTLGVLGAMMSSLHLFFLHRSLHPGASPGIPVSRQISNALQHKRVKRLKDRMLQGLSLWKLRIDILRSPYGVTILLMFIFHTVQFLGIPIFPVYSVNGLRLSDQSISLGLAMFYATVFIGSFFVARLTHRLGHQKLFGGAICFFGLYPLLMIFSHQLWMYLVTSAIGGVVWAFVGGAVFNYVLDKVPESDRPTHIAWYIIAMNLGMLVGSLGGPWLANMFGLVTVLAICSVARAVAGAVILRWG